MPTLVPNSRSCAATQERLTSHKADVLRVFEPSQITLDRDNYSLEAQVWRQSSGLIIQPTVTVVTILNHNTGRSRKRYSGAVSAAKELNCKRTQGLFFRVGQACSESLSQEKSQDQYRDNRTEQRKRQLRFLQAIFPDSGEQVLGACTDQYIGS